jgi:hypothetical protein
MKVPPGWDMPREIRARLGDRFGRQREIEADGHLFLVLHKVPAPGISQREGVFFWRNPAGDWRSTDRGQPRLALQQVVDAYESAVNQLGEKHESSNTAAERFAVLEQIGPLHRALRNLANTLQRARDAVADVDAKRDIQLFADHAGDVARTCELLQADARNSLDFHIARQGEIQATHSRETERAGHRLNVMAAIFLPLTAVSSVFGMNLQSGLENSPPWMFWLILAGSFSVGLLVSEVLVAVKLRGRR